MSKALTKPEVVKVYARTAPYYDLWATLTESRARRRVIDMAAVRDGEAVLEVAVGTGLLFVELLKRNMHGRTVGIDLTDAMLEQARVKAERADTKNWELLIGDAYALDFPAACFDVLINCFMFDLLPQADFGRVLGEFHRVLRQTGRLVLANLVPTGRPTYRLWDFLFRINPSWVGGCRGVQLADALAGAGFSIQRCERVSQLTLVTEVLLATS